LVQNVTYSVFSSIQDDNTKIISGYTKLIRSLLAVVFPLLVLVFITSSPLIHIVLGDKWMPVVPYLKLMVLYGWITVVQTFNNQIITVKGRSDYYLYIKIIDKSLIVISIFLTFKYGIMAMIYGHMVATLLSYIAGNFYLNKIINISVSYQIRNIIPFLISALFMLLSSWPISIHIANEYLYLIVSILTGTLIYIFALWIFRIEELKSGINWAKQFLKNKSL